MKDAIAEQKNEDRMLDDITTALNSSYANYSPSELAGVLMTAPEVDFIGAQQAEIAALRAEQAQQLAAEQNVQGFFASLGNGITSDAGFGTSDSGLGVGAAPSDGSAPPSGGDYSGGDTSGG